MNINFKVQNNGYLIISKRAPDPHSIHIPMRFKFRIRIKFAYLCTSKTSVPLLSIKISGYTPAGEPTGALSRAGTAGSGSRAPGSGRGPPRPRSPHPPGPASPTGRSPVQLTRTSVSCILYKINQSIKLKLIDFNGMKLSINNFNTKLS
jgi:hypothetical protein